MTIITIVALVLIFVVIALNGSTRLRATYKRLDANQMKWPYVLDGVAMLMGVLILLGLITNWLPSL